jgi:hypothetical protein
VRWGEWNLWFAFIWLTIWRFIWLWLTDRITEHLKTNIWMIEQFLPVRFEVKEVTGRVSVEGIGLSV